MSTHNIGFYEEISKKNIIQFLQIHLISSSDSDLDTGVKQRMQGQIDYLKKDAVQKFLNFFQKKNITCCQYLLNKLTSQWHRKANNTLNNLLEAWFYLQMIGHA